VAVSLHVVGMLIDNSLVTTAVHMRPQALVVDPLEVAVTVDMYHVYFEFL